jgi:hypothetical protein
MSKNTTSHVTRGRGILTETDRKYLLGEVEYDDNQQQRNRRRYIRDRARNGIIDFILLSELEKRDRKQIFSDFDSENILDTKIGAGKTQTFAGMCAAIRLFYIVSDDLDIDFESMLFNGVRDAENELTGRQLEEIQIKKKFEDDVEFGSSNQSVKVELSLPLSKVEKILDYLDDESDISD